MARTSTRRLFGVYALASLLPVVALGVGLDRLSVRQADARGLAQAQGEASFLAGTALSPLLDGPLTDGFSRTESDAVTSASNGVIRNGQVLRLRVRDTTTKVVFSSDRSAPESNDDEAVDAAQGAGSAHLTRLDGDGPRVVEAYEPLVSGRTVVGVVELYLPYAPIAGALAQDREQQQMVLVGGLFVLWLLLLLVTLSVTRRLRRQVSLTSHLAQHDALTGLPNRRAFAEMAAEVLTLEGRAAVAVLDVDRFKEVNDTLGHAVGDQLLVTTAARLQDAVREGDVLARLGGDEFGILLRDVDDARQVGAALTRLRQALAVPLVLEGLPLALEGSVGFALAPLDGKDFDDLLSKADVAMYVAKDRHLGVVRYGAHQARHDATALRLLGELGAAIENDELVLHYQPKTDLRAGRVTAVEALVRWQHPTRGLLYPDAFLPAAEQTELVEALTRWVLHRATSTLPLLDPSGELSVAVNVSARSLSRPDFAEDVMGVLASTGTDPRRVLLEITETALLADPDRAAGTLNSLSAMGVRVSIDDFGAGQTSLGYLATLPVSELKIDKAFVMAMDRDPRNAAIVRSVIDLGHNLGFSVTAEGVETEAVLGDLAAAQCDLVQGYLLGRPAPADRVRDHLALLRA